MELAKHPTVLLQRGCIAVSQALALGWTHQRFAELARSPEVQHPYTGMIAIDADLDDPMTRAWAAILTQCDNGQLPPGVLVAKDSAVRLWFGNELPSQPIERLLVPPGHTGVSRRLVRLHQEVWPSTIRRTLLGLPVASPACTVLDIARRWGWRRGVIAADTAYRRGLVDERQLKSLLRSLKGLRGVVAARRAVEHARPGVDSVRESQLRVELIAGSLPPPDVNISIFDPGGRMVGRTELGYERLLIAIEHDGYEVHAERRQFVHDRRRWRYWRERGWDMRVFTADDLAHPAAIVREIRRAIADAPSRIAALDSRRSPEVAAARRALGFGG